ncbi:MAG: PQQ-dependent sugar dehydrogenase, partial [Rhodanobacteraceae bacterium]
MYRHLRPIVAIALLLPLPALADINPPDLHLERFPDANTTFAQPIAVRAPNDGSGRVFIIERCSDIRIVENNQLLATPFLSITPSCGGEQGILGLAFDPDFVNNGTFYVTYTAPGSDPQIGAAPDQVLARYTVSPPDGDVANPTGEVILRVPDIASNHNGGDIHFG